MWIFADVVLIAVALEAAADPVHVSAHLATTTSTVPSRLIVVSGLGVFE